MRARLPILGGAQGVPVFEQPSFLAEVQKDSAGVDDTLASVDLLLSASSAALALEDGLLQQFALDLVSDSPSAGELAGLDASPMLSDHAAFVGQGDTLLNQLGGTLKLPPAPQAGAPPVGGGAPPRAPQYKIPPVQQVPDIPSGQYPGEGQPSCFASAACGPDGPYIPPPITGEGPGSPSGGPAPGSEGEPLPEDAPQKE